MIRRIAGRLKRIIWREEHASAGRRLADADHAGLPERDPGINAVLSSSMAWMARAQDCSKYRDGGVARHFDCNTGWSASYPETTGYILPTFLAMGGQFGRQDWIERGQRMLDWLVRIQLPDGSFQGGMIDSTPVVPVAFNTGQILLGLASGERQFGSCGDALRAAADWLVKHQDPDGCWRKGASPFARQGDKTYDTHIAWGLLEAARVVPDSAYVDAAMANVHWAMSGQRPSGWLANCCLTYPEKPLTHTLGYALRGLLEAHRFAADPSLLAASVRLSDGIMSAMGPDGFIPGQLREDWSPAADWACLTGTAQVAHCWLLLFEFTGERKYLVSGRLANSYVRRTVAVEGDPDFVGGVRGSFPLDGAYCRFQFPNWAAKFLVDSLMLEQRLA